MTTHLARGWMPRLLPALLAVGWSVLYCATAPAQAVSGSTRTGPHTPAPPPTQYVINGGLDEYWGGIVQNGSVHTMKVVASVDNSNRIYARSAGYNSGAWTCSVEVRDTTMLKNTITDLVPLGCGGNENIFLAASPLGNNFAWVNGNTQTGGPGPNVLNFTTDSGQNWVQYPLPKDTASGYVNSVGINNPYQMFFGPNGNLYAFYHTYKNNGGSNTARFELNLYMIDPAGVGTHYILSTADGQFGAANFINAVSTDGGVVLTYKPAPFWHTQSGLTSAVPGYFTFNYTDTNPATQGKKGWIGEAPGGNGYTNINDIMLANDGDPAHIFALYAFGAVGQNQVKYAVTTLALTNGYFVNNAQVGSSDPLTNPTLLPQTDITGFTAPINTVGARGSILYFDSVKKLAPSYGTFGPNVVLVPPNSSGTEDFSTFHVVNIRNPLTGLIGFSQPREDITQSMLPPGHVQVIGDSSGFYRNSTSGVRNGMYYAFGRNLSQAVGFPTVDYSY